MSEDAPRHASAGDCAGGFTNISGGGGPADIACCPIKLALSVCCLSISAITFIANNAARMLRIDVSAPSIASTSGVSCSLNDKRKYALLAKFESSQNVHQTGKNAGGLKSLNIDPVFGTLLFHNSLVARYGTTRDANGINQLPTAQPEE